jgi:3-methyladenine DNA glycosylase AlkD
MIEKIKKELQSLSDPEKAKILSRFFKTGKGEYGEGDIFLGVVVPTQRQVAKKYRDLMIGEIRELLHSPVHEHRLTALLILVDKYKRADEKEKKIVYEFYLKNTAKVNNWDLVDLSAPSIVGVHLCEKKESQKDVLYTLAKSENIWERRISIISTYSLIRQNRFEDTLKISKILLKDKHDLIHKAVGWMLREVGKRDMTAEERFLKENYKKMPRTMLRYAIEKFDEKKMRQYLAA